MLPGDGEPVSDYLDNLLARTMNPKDVIQPRPVSMFEPIMETHHLPSDDLQTLESEAGASTFTGRSISAPELDRPMIESPQSPQRTQRASPAPPGIQPGFSDEQPQALARHTPPESRELTQIAVNTPQKPGPSQKESLPPVKRIAASDERRIKQDHSPAHKPTPQPTPATQIVPLATSPLLPVISPARETEPPRSVTIPEIVAQIAPDKAAGEPEAPVLVHPQVIRYIEPARMPFSPPAPAPSITVSIGRVEVRAAPAPSPATKMTPASAPVQSLEEYMRQRRGGRQ